MDYSGLASMSFLFHYFNDCLGSSMNLKSCAFLFSLFALFGCNTGSGTVEQISAQSPTPLSKDDLHGTWRAVAARVDGAPSSDMMGVEYTFEASGELLIRRPERDEPQRHSYEVDSKPNPPHLNIMMEETGKRVGIFRIKDGKLYICRSAIPEKYERPTAFVADRLGYAYYIFERVR